jgi:hypothetical protein
MHVDGNYEVGTIYKLVLSINIRASPWEHIECLTTINSHTRKKNPKISTPLVPPLEIRSLDLVGNFMFLSSLSCKILESLSSLPFLTLGGRSDDVTKFPQRIQGTFGA